MGVTQAKPYAKSELSAIVLTGYQLSDQALTNQIFPLAKN